MTKAKLIDADAKSESTTKAVAESLLETLRVTAAAEVDNGGTIAWSSFGSPSASGSEKQTGRNPRTGETVKIAATTRMKFAASSTLKAALSPTEK